MHKTVLNPETGRHVSIKGKTGQSILKKYYNQSGGNPIFIHFPLPQQRHNIETPDKLLEKQIVHSCHRCTKLIALRKQIDTQLQHSCKRCEGLYKVKQDRDRVKQLARPMIQQQQTKQLKDMLKPMLMLPKLFRSDSAPATLSKKSPTSSAKPTSKKVKVSVSPPKKSPKSSKKPTPKKSPKKIKVSVSPPKKSPKSSKKPTPKKSPGKVKVKVSPAKKSPKSSRKQTRKK